MEIETDIFNSSDISWNKIDVESNKTLTITSGRTCNITAGTGIYSHPIQLSLYTFAYSNNIRELIKISEQSDLVKMVSFNRQILDYIEDKDYKILIKLLAKI